MVILSAVVTLAAAWMLTLMLTPWAAKLAQRWGALDHPDGHRKSQQVAVSTAGGVVVAFSVALGIPIAMLVAPLLGTPAGEVAFAEGSILIGLLPASIVLVAVGIIDDVLGLTGIYKVIGQVLAVSLLVSGGFHFDYISLFWTGFPLGNLSIPFTMFFCLGAINAFNLIDGIDGLASVLGTLAFLTLGIITASEGNIVPMMLCMAFSGALLGFLRYNLPPAKIYLGDTGSMLIGLVVSALAIHCSLKEQAAFVMLVPLAICAIPILDAGAALIRRVTTGQSVFTADRGHLHHSLLLLGWSVGKTVAFIAALATITCCGALASFFTHQEGYALAATASVFVALAAFEVFGHTELKLLFSHFRALLGTLLRRSQEQERVSEKSIHLQGTGHWDSIWQALLEAVPVYQLSGITLRINIPHLHESFYGDWKNKDRPRKTMTSSGSSSSEESDQAIASGLTSGNVAGGEIWKISMPLTQNGVSVGKLTLIGPACSSNALMEMQQVLDFLEPLESEIQLVINQAAADQAAASDDPSCAGPSSVEPITQFSGSQLDSTHNENSVRGTENQDEEKTQLV